MSSFVIANKYCELVTDGTHDSPKKTESGVKLVTSRNIIGGKLDLSSAYFISSNDAENINKRSRVDVNDILISMIGTVGESCFVSENPDFVIKNVGLFKFNSNDFYKSKWLFFYLQSDMAKNAIKDRLRGTTQQYIPLGELRKFPVLLPKDEKHRKFVVDYLSDLDDKIQLNTQTNQTLEQIAQAIFKSWFVDFDPVKAKIDALANGGTHADAERAAMQVISGKTNAELTQMQQTNPDAYKTLEKTAALFPSEMVESELGEVPKGWGYCKVGDVVDRLKNPQKLKKDDISEDYSVPVFEQGSNILMGYTQVAGFEADIENPMFIFGDHTCVTHLSTTPFSSYQNVITLKGFNLSTYWVYWAVRDKQKFQEYRRHWMEFIVKDIIVPDNKLLCDKFSERVKYFHKKIDENTKENQTLSEIRDSLLPRLLSGEFV